jgi:ribokinase
VTDSAVVVVGSITTDVTAFAHRLPAPGETVLGHDLTLVLGGKGANQAVAAAHFGVPTWMVGCIGQDPFADIAGQGLRGHGVSTEYVRRVDQPTGVAHIRVDATGQNDIVITPLANTSLNEDDVDAALHGLGSRARVMLLQLEVRAEITAYAAAQAAARGITVVLDPAPAVQVPEDTWAHVDIVTPNETEAALITGLPVSDPDTAFQAAQWFLDRGTRQVIVTLGEAGAVLASPTDRRWIESVRVQAVDATAAGDAFTGTLGAGLASGDTLENSVRHAMAAGALAVTKRGASPSLPQREDVLRLLAGTPAP